MKENILKQYVLNLDLYIVSHGGVGTEYMVSYLKHKRIICKLDAKCYKRVTHYAYPLCDKTPTLYIHGDYLNAIMCLYKKHLLIPIANNIHQTSSSSLKMLIDHDIDDPVGIKKQYSNFKNRDNVYMLKYPYSMQELQNALQYLNINVDVSDLQIRERNTKKSEYVNCDKDLKQILSVYKDFHI